MPCPLHPLGQLPPTSRLGQFLSPLAPACSRPIGARSSWATKFLTTLTALDHCHCYYLLMPLRRLLTSSAASARSLDARIKPNQTDVLLMNKKRPPPMNLYLPEAGPISRAERSSSSISLFPPKLCLYIIIMTEPRDSLTSQQERWKAFVIFCHWKPSLASDKQRYPPIHPS